MKFKTAAVLAALTAALGVARADERFFTYVYEADVLPKGRWEFEQWLTYRQGNPGGDPQSDQYLWDFREEIEYSPFEGLSTSLYLNFQQNTVAGRESELPGTSDFSFKGISGEFKYQLLNPVIDPVGLALYFEPTFNGDEYELEEKLILSKNLGEHWVLAANASFEQEWEREDGQTVQESVFEVGTGAAYRFTPHWSAGLEGRYHNVYEGLGFNERLGSAWFLGPNLHYGSARWWATLSGLPQISGSATGDDGRRDLVEHQKFEIRLLVGVSFWAGAGGVTGRSTPGTAGSPAA